MASQLLEAAQWGWFPEPYSEGDKKVEGYVAMMLCEEVLEMTGSAFFALTSVRLGAIRGRII